MVMPASKKRVINASSWSSRILSFWYDRTITKEDGKWVARSHLVRFSAYGDTKASALRVSDFPYWFAVMLEQLTPEELSQFLRPHPYRHNGLDIQAAILRVVEDLLRQEGNGGRTDDALNTLLLEKLREYIGILD